MLDREVFETLVEAKVLVERWRWEYNHIRPHKSIEDLTGHAVEIMKKIKSNTKLIASYYTHVYAI